MKKLKICTILLISFLIFSCQKEEINPDLQNLESVEHSPEASISEFDMSTSTSQTTLAGVDYILVNSEPNSSSCSSFNILWEDAILGIMTGLNGTGNNNYFGGYFTKVGGEYIQFRVSDFDFNVVHEEWRSSTEEFYWGISSDQNLMIQIESYNGFMVRDVGLGVCKIVADSDGDGCPDSDDSTVSNMEATVTLHGCDTGVVNRVTSTCGVMMSDLIDQLEVGTYFNHGGFVKEVGILTETWLLEGLISQDEKGAIVACAGKSN